MSFNFDQFIVELRRERGKVFDKFVWKPIVGAIRSDGDGK